ncbi:MAG: type II secretion system protein [Sedimentibacter sp.]|uniref:pilus assembly FimT family protein n=1 Tax=Sedimentibacter sp. TaxID=1960295 RepID=UPI0031595CD8
MSKCGFTLIETVVTIFILMLLLTLAVPMLDYDFAYMDKMANEFAMDLRRVQMESMKKPGTEYTISINRAENCYYVKKEAATVKLVKFKERYKINYSNSNMDAIGFTYEGMPVNAGTFSIFDTKTNAIKEISIVPTTGRTIIKE